MIKDGRSLHTFRVKMRNVCPTTHFCLDSIVAVAQVLQVGGCVGLHGGEVVLQHVDHLRQLRVTPRKLPAITGEAQKHRLQIIGNPPTTTKNPRQHSQPLSEQTPRYLKATREAQEMKSKSHHNSPWSHLDLSVCAPRIEKRDAAHGRHTTQSNLIRKVSFADGAAVSGLLLLH